MKKYFSFLMAFFFLVITMISFNPAIVKAVQCIPGDPYSYCSANRAMYCDGGNGSPSITPCAPGICVAGSCTAY